MAETNEFIGCCRGCGRSGPLDYIFEDIRSKKPYIVQRYSAPKEWEPGIFCRQLFHKMSDGTIEGYLRLCDHPHTTMREANFCFEALVEGLKYNAHNLAREEQLTERQAI